jgi:hypothetical protein
MAGTFRPARAALCALALSAATLPAAFDAEAQPKPAAASKSGTGALLQKAQDLFDDQRYEESIQTLSAALLRPGTSPENKIEIYRLLAYNYITLGRTEEADGAVRGLLVQKEDFELSNKESPRFRDFFAKARAAWEAEGKPGKDEGGGAKAPPPVSIKHTAAVQVDPDAIVKIEGTIEDPSTSVTEVQLFFRSSGAEKFSSKPLVYAMGSFRGQLPQNIVQPPLVEYYLLALDAKGLPLASRGDSDTPVRVAVREPENDSIFASPWFWIPVGVVVVGGVVAAAVIASSGGDDPPTDPPNQETPRSRVIIGIGE